MREELILRLKMHDLRRVVNPGEKISFAKYRHVANSEASGFTTSRYVKVITVFQSFKSDWVVIFIYII